MSVDLRYDGTAVGSNENFNNITSFEAEPFSQPLQILKRTDFPNIGNPTDLYSVSLDGSSLPLPEENEKEKIGIWSVEQTDDAGEFSSPVSLVLQADRFFSSAGITLVCDTHRGIFANSVRIAWYQDSEKIAEESFSPDSAEYFCSKKVEFFNKIEISFISLNAPKNRLRLQGVFFGIETHFTAREIKKSSVKHSLSKIADSLSIGSLSFSIISREGIDFVFEERQPVDAFFNDRLIGRYYIKSASKTGQNAYTVKCEDYIGLLDGAMFEGGVYDSYRTSVLIRDICDTAGVPVMIENENLNETVTGYLPRMSCRKALQQVLFAIQKCAVSGGSRTLVIKKLSDEITQEIPKKRIMQGISVKEEEAVTGVEIVAHKYTPSEEEEILYDAQRDGEADRIEIIFSEPMYSLRLTNGDFIGLGKKNNNSVVIMASKNTVLYGKKYIHTTTRKTKNNPLFEGSGIVNVKKIETATLVNPKNIDSLLETCYNYFEKNRSISAKIVEGKHESENGYVSDMPVFLGDRISIETEFSGTQTASVESQSFNMNGGILIKNSILR